MSSTAVADSTVGGIRVATTRLNQYLSTENIHPLPSSTRVGGIAPGPNEASLGEVALISRVQGFAQFIYDYNINKDKQQNDKDKSAVYYTLGTGKQLLSGGKQAIEMVWGAGCIEDNDPAGVKEACAKVSTPRCISLIYICVCVYIYLVVPTCQLTHPRFPSTAAPTGQSGTLSCAVNSRSGSFAAASSWACRFTPTSRLCTTSS